MAKSPQSFRTILKEDLLKEQNFRKEIEVKKQAVLKLASECLDDPKFKKYRKEFEDFRETIFNHMAEPLNPDPVQDAFYLRACINTVNVLDMLIGKVKRDIRA